MLEDARNLALHVEAAHDAVDHPVREQELAALEPLGQLLADGALDDARPCEPDERAGLGEVHVAQEGEARRDAAGGRVQEDAEEGKPGVLQALERGDGLGHLHEAEDPLLHPRAARRLQEHDREPLGRRALEEARDLLARRREPIDPPMNAKRNAPHAIGLPSMLRAPDFDGLSRVRRPLRRGDALRVALAVDELERIGGLEVRVPLLERAVVERGGARHPAAPSLWCAPHWRADLEVARRALRPRASRRSRRTCGRRPCRASSSRRRRLGGLLVGPGHRGLPSSVACRMAPYTLIVDRSGETLSVGSVFSCTSRALTPGATSRRTSPSGVTSMTASSVMIRWTTPRPVSGRVHSLQDLGRSRPWPRAP